MELDFILNKALCDAFIDFNMRLVHPNSNEIAQFVIDFMERENLNNDSLHSVIYCKHKEEQKELLIGGVIDSLIFKGLTTLTINQGTEYLMLDIRDGNVTNTKYLNKEQTKKLKEFLNYR